MPTRHCLLLACLAVIAPMMSAATTSGDERPNILFAIADDASFPHMSAYGTQWVQTPGFDRVAEMGLRFDRCYTPNAKCAPSRSCLLTGRNSWQLGQAANHWCYFPPEISSYVDVLGQNGYATGMTGKGWAPGVALDRDGNRRQLAGRPFSKRKAKPPTKKISGNDYAGNFKDFLSTVKPDEPFCFWYGATEPHRAYEYGTGVRLGGKSTDSIQNVPPFWPDNETVRNDMLDYALEIEHFDSHLNRMIDLLAESGKLDNTLIVVTSDNGMPFPRVKGQAYEWSNHLPLAIAWPKGIRTPGRAINDLVSFIDLAPTYLEIAGIDWEASAMASEDHPRAVGKSLTDVFADDPKHDRDFVVIGKERHDVGRPGDAGYPIRGIIQGAFLLVENYETDRWPAGNPETGYLNTDGSPTKTSILDLRRNGQDRTFWNACFGKRPNVEMFNILTDGACLSNLATIERYAETRAEMTARLQQVLKEQKDPRAMGNGNVFDEYPTADKKTQGFYSRYVNDPESIKAGWVNESDFETETIEP